MHHDLAAPLAQDAVARLRVRDTVSLTGRIFGIRDATQIRIFDEGVPPPVDLTGAVCLHTAPGVRRRPDGSYEKLSIGTTTSTRMDRFVPGLLDRYGVRAVVGKGGLLAPGVAAMREHGGVYLAITGGAAALETLQIEEIEQVWWEDLMPECLWQFRVRAFGPLIVAVDAHGGNLYADVTVRARERLSGMGF
ncbi:MAG: fumarate hydrolyase [Acidobacteria bacterium]|nr:fumarate hydrolyase [Acidobacteriota bacterium]